MQLRLCLLRARFVARLNRFAAIMCLEGENVMAHIANSGRLNELLQPENTMFIAPAAAGTHRKTAYDLALVEIGGVLVSVDARLPGLLMREAIEANLIPQFSAYDCIRSEVALYDSRIDLMLSGNQGQCYIETKSVTLVENSVALFPDAPTERGRKHVLALQRAAQEGHRAAVVFVTQRSDAMAFSLSRTADSKLCDALAEAVANGVEVYAFACHVTQSSIRIVRQIPVQLD